MARQVASLYGVLSLRDDDYRNKLAENRTNTASFSSQLTSIGGQMQSFGAGMTAFMAPIGLALGASVNSSRNFASEMANVNSIIQLGVDDASALNAQVQAFGSTNTFGPIANAGALYSIVSAGITDTATAMEVLSQSVNAAESGQADLGATTAAMVSLMNSYSLGADGAQYASDILARTVQTGVGTMGEFATALPTVTGLSSQFGIGLDEVAGSMSYMTTQGFSASQSATFLRSMMTTLLNPTADLGAAITSLGYESGQSLLESEGLVAAYQLLAEQNGGLAGLITNQEALTGSLVMTGASAEEALMAYILGVDGATASMQAAQAEAQGWDRLRSSVEGLAISVGNLLLPFLTQLVEQITPVILGVSEWIAANPQLASTIAMVAAGLVVLGPVIMAIGTAFSALGVIIGLIASPVGIVIAGMVALGAVFVQQSGGMSEAWTNFNGVIETIQAAIMPAINTLIATVGRIWQDVSPSLNALFGWFINTGMPLIVDFLNATVMPAIDLLVSTISTIWEFVSPYLGDLYDWFVTTGLLGIVTYIEGPFTTAFTGITTFLSSIWDLISPGVQLLQDNLVSAMTFIIDNAIGPLSDALSSAWGAYTSFTSATGNALNGAGNFINNINPFTNTTQLGGARARGGPVSAGRSYLVGENGPEMFTPSVGGGITPNNELGQGGGETTISVGSIVVNANTEAEGRVAGRAALDEIMTLARSRGIAIGVS